MKFGAITKDCTCSHAFQDRRYGKKKRVHNLAKEGERARCTVCNDEKIIGKGTLKGL